MTSPRTSGKAPKPVVSAWIDEVGAKNVIVDAVTLSKAETATFSTSNRIVAIVRPGSLAEVQSCVRLARRYRTALYPISGGKNWGYGSRVPPRTNCALLDLSRMNKISALDRRNGVLTVQPGVTQGQLCEFLRTRAPEYWMDTTASAAEASVLANVLERGHGHTPYGDHVAFACDFQVVLTNGELARTGAGRFPGCRTARLDRNATGPCLDGLFIQSNLGIVTEMSIWLFPAPERAVVGRLDLQDGDLERVLDVFRTLKFSSAPISGPQVLNAYRQLQRRDSYPWASAAGKTPLSKTVLDRLAREHGIPPWRALFGIYGSAEQVAGLTKTITRHLSAFRPEFKTVVRNGKRVGTEVFHDPTFGAHACFIGELPGSAGLVRTYWRKKERPALDNLDPDRDRCGFLWVTPVVPFHAADVKRATAIITRGALRDGFEPAISFSHVRDRGLHYYASLSYDRDIAGEDKRAMRCHAEITERLMKAGYYFHRLPIVSMNVLDRQDKGFATMLKSLKDALDPAGIVAPGRYIPAR